ncbi:MAG: ATPase [Methanobrevibacter thaueri]|jgi:hypothetical protein|uniref:ATPase n=1 Tax=Methanobrevibacter thaueri TaxID=190975 RepID=UPI0026F1AB1F|nr:ATPase [Methanobrevibacter thaueri]MBE6495638.1 ATPase [Methanobrevibacter thaueri]
MNDITIILWITIALIAIIAIILVKLHYRGDELENDEGSILPSSESINSALNAGKQTINSLSGNNNEQKPSNQRRSLSPQNTQQTQKSHNLFRKSEPASPKNDAYIVPEVEPITLNNFEYESQNQVLINYDNTVEKFQEPIKQSQMDIMTQNNKDTTELKDLFTIDELIKESKRKDSEREKESKTIKKEGEDPELEEIKESIKNKTEEPLIEEIINEEKEEKISDIIKDTKSSEAPSVASQKDIDEAISSASEESEKTIESISEDDNITETLLKQESEEIEEPALKTPSKVDDKKDYKMGASIDDANLFEDDPMDLDYRKDLDKITNKIKGSKIFQEVKDKLVQENEEIPQKDDGESFIRNVNDYDPYEPIINERHIDFDADYNQLHQMDNDERLRQANTRRVFNMAKNSPEPELARPKVGAIKSKPSRDNIKIELNNNEVVLKKGDEIIFNHLGETYSSQVYAINGDDISVKYRRQNITIKPSDVKKIY